MLTRTRITIAFVALALAIAPGPAAAVDVDHIKPMPGAIVRHFEPPPTPYATGHRGIDIAAPIGTPVIAAADGKVAFAGKVGGQLFVSIDHADGLRTTYSFLSAVLVKAGTVVVQGTRIALSGAGHAGDAKTTMHFGLRRGDTYLDPEPVLLRSLRRNLWRVIHLAPVEGVAS